MPLDAETAAKLARQPARIVAEYTAWVRTQRTGQYTPPPAQPKRMSDTLYRALYDSRSVLVIVDDDGHVQLKCAGPVSGEVVAASYRADGRPVTIKYAPARKD